jgi:hypothetical protein
MVTLMDGQRLPMSAVRSVAKTDDVGAVLAAWTVREHGYDGAGPIEEKRLLAEP